VPMYIQPVKRMYDWINARYLSGDNSGRATESHVLWDEEYTKSLIFLHGANVSSSDAEKWGDILFKRLWVSGSRARFYNVDWKSDIGSAANYHQNASNAFAVAVNLASVLTSRIPGEKVVMAHSLGNVVASSMINDYGLVVSKYLMCNSAVPAEAYDPDESLRVPQLVHPEWEEYPTNSWASSWHALFMNDPDDDRKYLGWPGRFTNVLNVAVNFYSAGDNGGDEVLELAADNDVDILTGITSSLSHHSWHKQELFKGRGIGVGAGATDWSGWNIEENLLGVDKISVEKALQMSDEDFKTNTVFYCYPPSMNSTNITLLVRGAHLALGIPALSPAAGAARISMLSTAKNINLDNINENDNGVARPNGWPSKSSYPDRWLHSDIKDTSYYYNFRFYQLIIEKGGLR
ncbi:MAG: alpha/beta hydrolase, partial [Kiritimatiellae bacterium]|nr:alpha/beta hydrolase [Kiritimatiellia bacterium]